MTTNFTPAQLRRIADILESNDDQPGFDFASALAAMEAEDMDDDKPTTDLRPATNDEADAYYAGHQVFPGAVETEHGLLVPSDHWLIVTASPDRPEREPLVRVEPGTQLRDWLIERRRTISAEEDHYEIFTLLDANGDEVDTIDEADDEPTRSWAIRGTARKFDAIGEHETFAIEMDGNDADEASERARQYMADNCYEDVTIQTVSRVSGEGPLPTYDDVIPITYTIYDANNSFHEAGLDESELRSRLKQLGYGFDESWEIDDIINQLTDDEHLGIESSAD